MTKDEISKIKEHIEIHAKRERRAIVITEILWKAVDELEHIAGAKENSVVWHDLRINPDDLPKRCKHENRSPLIITNKGIGHYNFIKKTWYIYNEECNCSFLDTVIAWCETPKFEVKE